MLDVKPQDVRAVEALNKQAKKFVLALLDMFSKRKLPDLSLRERRGVILILM